MKRAEKNSFEFNLFLFFNLKNECGIILCKHHFHTLDLEDLKGSPSAMDRINP